jgi:hypothetical protein
VPPASFEPLKVSLLVYGADNGADGYFRSILCRLENRGNVGEVAEMRTSGKMFVARFRKSTIGILNFGLTAVDQLSGPVQ